MGFKRPKDLETRVDRAAQLLFSQSLLFNASIEHGGSFVAEEHRVRMGTNSSLPPHALVGEQVPFPPRLHLSNSRAKVRSSNERSESCTKTAYLTTSCEIGCPEIQPFRRVSALLICFRV